MLIIYEQSVLNQTVSIIKNNTLLFPVLQQPLSNIYVLINEIKMINRYHNLPNSKSNYMGYHNSWHNNVKVYVHQVSAAGKHKVMPLLVLYKPT